MSNNQQERGAGFTVVNNKDQTLLSKHDLDGRIRSADLFKVVREQKKLC